MFGAGHLPPASALVGTLDANVEAFAMGANLAFGLLFGYLVWRFGLESAMIAHAVAHVVSCWRACRGGERPRHSSLCRSTFAATGRGVHFELWNLHGLWCFPLPNLERNNYPNIPRTSP